MKVTKLKALNINSAIDHLKSKNQLESKGVKFARNKRVLVPILEEYKEIIGTLKADWKKEYNLDEKLYSADEKYRVVVNTAYNEFESTNIDLKEFLEEEVDINFHTFSEESIENESVDWNDINVLTGTIILID